MKQLKELYVMLKKETEIVNEVFNEMLCKIDKIDKLISEIKLIKKNNKWIEDLVIYSGDVINSIYALDDTTDDIFRDLDKVLTVIGKLQEPQKDYYAEIRAEMEKQK